MLDDMDNTDVGGRGTLELRLELVGLLKGIEDMEGSIEFLPIETRQVLGHALLEVRRRMSVTYIV